MTFQNDSEVQVKNENAVEICFPPCFCCIGNFVSCTEKFPAGFFFEQKNSDDKRKNRKFQCEMRDFGGCSPVNFPNLRGFKERRNRENKSNDFPLQNFFSRL